MITGAIKIFANAFILFTLLGICLCVTVYDLNRIGSKSFDDDGSYRPIEHNNDEAFYRFGYKVNAIQTGDIKQHTEQRVKNDVKGAYFVIEPSGVSRFVEYIANSNGFNAVVRHQFGDEYSKNLDTYKSTQSGPFRQVFHTNILNEFKANNEENLSQKPQQVMAFDRFLQEPNDDTHQPQQIGTFRQSSPKSINNQSSIRLSETTSAEISASNLADSAAEPAPSNPTPIIGRRRQYEVIDPEVDIDIRRSISKPFLNLD